MSDYIPSDIRVPNLNGSDGCGPQPQRIWERRSLFGSTPLRRQQCGEQETCWHYIRSFLTNRGSSAPKPRSLSWFAPSGEAAKTLDGRVELSPTEEVSSTTRENSSPVRESSSPTRIDRQEFHKQSFLGIVQLGDDDLYAFKVMMAIMHGYFDVPGKMEGWMDENFIKNVCSAVPSPMSQSKSRSFAIVPPATPATASLSSRPPRPPRRLSPSTEPAIRNSSSVFKLNWASGGGLVDRPDDRGRVLGSMLRGSEPRTSSPPSPMMGSKSRSSVIWEKITSSHYKGKN
ncbi:hypothetical protein QBC38DRAFT_520870 [Podospora fimiseda]|uniref:Uncharacterized protein n=1 Tax=Podospora fimiseda TaxID=252190 RepID=A0AAN7BFR4_9PEZI|nr:hypothetical protein QBC38DRAFT_520870 [Podospora fimiseda]